MGSHAKLGGMWQDPNAGIPKIGYALSPIAMPDGIEEPEEVLFFNSDVSEYLSEGNRLTLDPFAIEDFGSYFGEMFTRLRERCLLHRRRAALLSEGGAATVAIDAKTAALQKSRDGLRENLLNAAVSCDVQAMAGLIKDSPGDKVISEEIGKLSGFAYRPCNDPSRDASAAKNCEDILRESFKKMVVVSDL